MPHPTSNPNPQSSIPNSPSHPTSDIPHPTSLSPQDRDRLSLLFRTRGDAVSMASLREEDPLETLAWLEQPHIKPWHDAIQKAHREHEATETHLSLARALKDITRILDLEADSTLRIRAVNAVIRLANAIHRSGSAAGWAAPGRSAGLAQNPRPSTSTSTRNGRAASAPTPTPMTHMSPMPPASPPPFISQELRNAQVRAQDSLIALDLHLDRRARLNQHLKEANAPVGSQPNQASHTTNAKPHHNGQAHHATTNGHVPRQTSNLPTPSGHARRSPRPPSPKKSRDPQRRRPRAP